MALKDRIEKYVTDESEQARMLRLLELADSLTGKEDPRIKSFRKVLELETDPAVTEPIKNRIAELESETVTDVDEALDEINNYGVSTPQAVSAGVKKILGGQVYAWQSGNKSNSDEDD